MVILKCCVGGCTATSDTHQLFCIPKKDNLRSLWLSFLVPTNPLLGELSKSQLITKRVCAKHFDKYQFDEEGRRLHYSYPCLFSELELALGEPRSTHVPDNFNRYADKNLTDHNYSKMDIGDLQKAKAAAIEESLELGDKADNIDGTDTLPDDDSIPESNEPNEEPVVPDKAYSWENKKEAVPIPADIGEDYEDNLSMYCDDGASPPHTREPQGDMILHQGYHCNVCEGEIRGFRYTCVQCNDFDLCSACELNRAHHHHYVLRVPEPRPYVEIHSILSRIRRHLMQKMDPVGDLNQDLDLDDVVSIKSEDEDKETMKETGKEVAENKKNLEEADFKNVADDIDTDTVEVNSSVTLKENVVHIKKMPTPSNSNVSREKRRSPTTGPKRLLMKVNMPQVSAKRICVMRVPSTRSATRQDGRRTSEDKSLTDWQPEAPDPLHIEQNASTKQTRSVYKIRFPLDNR